MPIKILCGNCNYQFYQGAPRSLYYNNESSILDHYRTLYNGRCPKCGHDLNKVNNLVVKPKGVTKA